MKMRTWFSGTLETRTALHIGTGSTLSTLTDAPLIRGADGRPLIPGSSVKGAMRSASERLLRALGERACLVFSDEASQDPQLQCLTTDKEARDLFFKLKKGEELDSQEMGLAYQRLGISKEVARPWLGFGQNEELQLSILQKRLCRACLTWGSPFLAGRVRVPDLRLNAVGSIPIEIRDGVGMDRDTGTAAKKIKFDLEALPAGARFAFETIAEPDADLAVVGLSVGELLQGNLPLGGRVTRGLGDVSLSHFAIYEVDLAKPAQLVPYLTRGERTAYQGDKAVNKLNEILGRLMEDHHAA